VCTCVVVNIKNEGDSIVANHHNDNVRSKRKILVNLNLNIVLFFFNLSFKILRVIERKDDASNLLIKA
jgi:hypothetical protein